MTPQFDPSTVEGWVRFLAIPAFGMWSSLWRASGSRQIFAIRVLATWTIVTGLLIENPLSRSDSYLSWAIPSALLVCAGAYLTWRSFQLLDETIPPSGTDSNKSGRLL